MEYQTKPRKAHNSRPVDQNELVTYKAAGKKWITKRRSDFKNAAGPCSGTLSYDADIWKDIVEAFCSTHKLTEEEFTKIVAFCFPAWGGRKVRKAGYTYWLHEADILNARMGWKAFKREIDKAIRLTRPLLWELDHLWDARKKYQAGIYSCLKVKFPPEDSPSETEEDEELSLEEDRELRRQYDNLVYGIWPGED